MKRSLFVACVAASAAFITPAFAADDSAPVGKAADTYMIRVRAIGVLPEDNSSTVSTIGGHVSASNEAAPEVDFSYFLTDNIAFELIAATTRHNLSATDTALGHVDVGSAWVLPPTVTAQYHFFPHERFSPYLGVGLNATLFYDVQHAGSPVNSLSLNNGIGPALQVGFDYNVMGHWFLNVDFKQIFLHTTAYVGTPIGTLKAKTNLDPAVVGAGVGYRF
jgi:outer membrane protein